MFDQSNPIPRPCLIGLAKVTTDAVKLPLQATPTPLEAPNSVHLNQSRHSSLDARFSKPGDNERLPLFHRCSEDRGVSREPLTECFFKKIDRDTPPSQDGANDPEISSYIHASVYSASIGEETACDGRSDRERGQDAA